MTMDSIIDKMHRSKMKEFDWRVHVSCDEDIMPSTEQIPGSLGSFGIGLIIISTLITLVTMYLSIDAIYKIFFQNQTRSYKKNSAIILSVYPVASICSLLALAIPRAQVLSEALTQITLTIALYSLYLVLIDVGRRKITKAPPLMLNVLPCCCWPCLPFPILQMTEANLSWLRIFVLQLPIVQTLVYVITLYMAMEEAILVTRYSIFLQTFAVISILLGIYGLTITTRSLEEAAPGTNLRRKTVVTQMVLLFSKLQGFIIKSVANWTSLFPCNPPLSPNAYASVTYNALMVIEMLMLCYAARLIYIEDDERDDDASAATDRTKDNNPGLVGVTNNNDQLPVQLAASTA
ncbi:organic solute transporter subunit alpha-like [Leptopilina heterotoma]|uniref:organic solute transporter subunit alpha-like n=1 Tax=Leptopilina heterotoma TaxID=63436 RepID=UPI001CA91A71|nr:organic solute transporter subunit alpha-like [Leptopilina heterotoma]